MSVVIATRNRRGLVLRAVASVLRQRHIASEAVVVDDCSTDGTAAAVSALPGPVRMIACDRQLGHRRACNAGLGAAAAPWIAFLDDDDIWSPDKLREQLDAAAGHRCDWVYSSLVIVNESLRPIDVVPAPAPDDLLPALLRRNVLSGGASNVCVKSELLRRCGGYDETLTHLGDWDLWIRLAAAATPARSSAVHVAYVQHPGSQIRAGREDPEAELDRLTKKHRELLRRHGVEPERAVVARWAAEGHRLAGRRWSAARRHVRNAVRHRTPADALRGIASLIPGEIPRRTGLELSPELMPAWLIDQAPEWLAAHRGVAPV